LQICEGAAFSIYMYPKNNEQCFPLGTSLRKK
jgi:hypothetical protein